MHRLAPTAVRALTAAAGLALLTAGSAGAATKRTQSVDIAFAALAGNSPVSCTTPLEGLGTTGQAAQLTDLRFFVSDVKLLTRSGRAVPVTLTPNAFRVNRTAGAVTLIDLENGKGGCSAEGTAATNDRIRGTVPKGTYTGVRWTIGVPFGLNHTDVPAAPAPLNLAAMGWSWQVGRKFTKIEISDTAVTTGGGGMHMGRQHGGMGTSPTMGTWSTPTFYVHLGSTGCSGNPATGQTVRCTTPNRANMRLTSFNPRTQKIAIDLKALFAGNDVTRNTSGAPGCMSEATDPECAGIFRSLGIGWRADGAGNGLSPTTRQTAFRAIAR